MSLRTIDGIRSLVTRLALRRARIPADLRVSVTVGDDGWAAGRSSYVLHLGTQGPLRLLYSIDEPKPGALWLRRVPLTTRQRVAALRVILGSGIVESGSAEFPRGRGRGASWVSVTTGGLSRWLVVAPGQRASDLPGFEALHGLVPDAAWASMHQRRTIALGRWDNASVADTIMDTPTRLGVPGRPIRETGPETGDAGLGGAG